MSGIASTYCKEEAGAHTLQRGSSNAVITKAVVIYDDGWGEERGCEVGVDGPAEVGAPHFTDDLDGGAEKWGRAWAPHPLSSAAGASHK